MPSNNGSTDADPEEDLATESVLREAPRNKTALDDAEDALDALFSTKATLPSADMLPVDRDPVPLAPTGSRDMHDPRMLLTVKASSRKAEKIVSFLPERVKERLQRRRRDKLTLTQAEDGTVSLKPNEQEAYAISMAEWGAANMRLLSHLLRKGDLAYKDVEFYLSYTMQIYELADKFEWPSIMEFDSRYRELQAEYNFHWGDMRYVSQIQLLTPRRQPSSFPPRRTTNANTTSKEDCKKWLASGGTSCPFGSGCRYIHRSMNNGQTNTASATKN
jgi:hypothetical protein